MTDTTSAAPPVDPGPPPPAPPGLPTVSDRFFSWVRGLGVVRADAWLGGVCGGIAARLRIDPIIVRGIFAVVAVLGFPALLVYAIAWALLPDTTGRIHLRELFRGRFDPAMIGILILTIVSFVPVVPWLWNAALWPVWATFGGFSPLPIWDLGSPLGGIGVILALAIIGGATFLIVRSGRPDRRARASRQASAESEPASAASPSGGDAAVALVAPAGGDADSAGRAPAESAYAASAAPDASTISLPRDAASAPDVEPGDAPAASTEEMKTLLPAEPAPVEPAPPAGPADDDAIAQWRASHDAWRAQIDVWRRSQQDAERAAREQARRERAAAGAAFAAEAEQRRRIRRTTRPRTSFVFVLTSLGAAIVTGAASALMAMTDAATAPFATAIGLFAAAVVSALAMIVAGAVRRRSGFLTAVTIVLLVVGMTTAVASGPRSLVLANLTLGTSTEPVSVTQPFGVSSISVSTLSDDGHVEAGTITIRKGIGDTYIEVYPGTVLDLEATLEGGGVSYSRIGVESGELVAEGVVAPREDSDGTAVWDWFVRNTVDWSKSETRQRIVIDQGAGSVYVTIYEAEDI